MDEHADVDGRAPDVDERCSGDEAISSEDSDGTRMRDAHVCLLRLVCPGRAHEVVEERPVRRQQQAYARVSVRRTVQVVQKHDDGRG